MTRPVTLYPFDYLTIGYCLIISAFIALVGRPIAGYVDEIVVYMSIAGMVGIIARYVDPGRSWLFRLLRFAYPVLAFTIFYSVTGGLMFLVHNQFFDWQLTTFEKLIMGVNPTLYIDKHLMNVWITEIVMFCYFVYYFLILGFTFTVFFRKHYRILRETLTAICVTFFVSYPLFFLYPIEGPRWHFADTFVNDVQGPVFRQVVNLIIENGAVRGGCVPSTHVAVALVILFACFRYYRRMGWILLPINIGLAVGTVWGRFHYVSDVIIGALIGTASVLVVWKYYERWDSDPTIEVSDSPRKMTHAT